MARDKENLRNESDEQLRSRIDDRRKELFDLKNELAFSHKVEKSHLLCEKRREIARLKTLLTERKSKEKGAPSSGKK